MKHWFWLVTAIPFLIVGGWLAGYNQGYREAILDMFEFEDEL